MIKPPTTRGLVAAVVLSACANSASEQLSADPSNQEPSSAPTGENGNSAPSTGASDSKPSSSCPAAALGPSDGEVAAIIAADFAERANDEKAQTLYLSLAHLTSGATECDVNLYRNGVGRLMNMLSRAPEIVPTTFIDPGKTVARFDVRKLRWSPETLAYALTMSTHQDYGVFKDVASGVSAVRLDWASEQLTRPQIYSYVMDNQLHERLIELQAGVHEVAKSVFGGVYQSTLAKNPRILERRESDYGACWITHDFLYRTQGFAAMESGELPPPDVRWGLHQYIAREYICTLPNGMQHYDLTGFISQRRWDVPTCAAHNDSREDQYVLTGQCYNCHGDGLISFQDKVRNGNPNPTALIQDRFPVQAEIDAVLAKDQAHYHDAVAKISFHDPSFGNPLNTLNKIYKKRAADNELWHSGGTFGAFLPKGGTLGPLWDDVIVPIQDLAIDVGILLPDGIINEDIPTKVIPAFKKKYEAAGLTEETCYDF
jgi:hypothetical protein